MNPLEFAMSIIRAPYLTKIKDKTFQAMIATGFGTVTAAYTVWQTPGVNVTDKVNLTAVAVASIAGLVAYWSGADKKKDTAIANTAITAQSAVDVAKVQGVFAPAPTTKEIASDALEALVKKELDKRVPSLSGILDLDLLKELVQAKAVGLTPGEIATAQKMQDTMQTLTPSATAPEPLTGSFEMPILEPGLIIQGTDADVNHDGPQDDPNPNTTVVTL